MGIMCPLLSNKTVKKQFNEIKDAVGDVAAYDIWSKNNGYSIDRAPDGSPSILFNALMKITNEDRARAIRMKAMVFKESFAKWYGRWFEKGLGEPDLHRAGIAVWYDNGGEQISAYNKRNVLASRYMPFVTRGVLRILDGLKFRLYRTSNRSKALRVFERRLKIGFGSMFADSIIQMYNEVWDYYSNNDGESIAVTLNDFYDKIERFVRYEFFDKTVPAEIKKLEDSIKAYPTRLDAEQKVKRLYSYLKNKTLTGDFSEDKKKIGDEIEIVTRMFPRLYNTTNINRTRGYYMHDILTNREKYINTLSDSMSYYMMSAKLAKLKSLLEAREALGKDEFDQLLINKINNEIVHLESLPEDKSTRFLYEREDKKTSSIFESLYLFPDGFTEYNERDLLKRVSKLRPEYKELCDYLLKNSKQDVKIRFTNDATKIRGDQLQEKNVRGYSAQHRPDNDSDVLSIGIFLRKSAFIDSSYAGSDVVDLFMHELIHTYTSSTLEDSPNIKSRLEDVLLYAKQHLSRFSLDVPYGFTNIDEFISEFVGNSDFRDFVAQIPSIDEGEYSLASYLNLFNKDSSINENLAQQLSGIFEYIILKHCEDYSQNVKDLTQDEVLSLSTIGLIVEDTVVQRLVELMKNPIMSAKKAVRDTIIKTNNAILKMILNNTVLLLLKAYNLERVVDADGKIYYRSKQSTDGKYDLVVEFVNYLSDENGEHEGWYDHNAKSTLAHHVIRIALDNASPATISHELAHHYIRMFWNSPLVQESLAAVFKEGMTQREVEEALVEEITNRVDPALGKNIFSSKFWETLGKMLQILVQRLTNSQRARLLDNCTKAFVSNETQLAWADSKFEMQEGKMYKTKESRYAQARQKAVLDKKNKKYETLYKQYDTNDPLQTAVSSLITGSISRVRIIGNYGSSSDKVIAQLRQLEQKSIDFANSVSQLREQRKKLIEKLTDEGKIVLKGLNKRYKKQKLITSSSKEVRMSFDYIANSLRDAVTDIEESIQLLRNAQTFNFVNIAYTTKVKLTKNASEDSLMQDRAYVEKEAVNADTTLEQFDFDKLQIVGKETVSYYKGLVKKIESILESSQDDQRISDELFEQMNDYLEKIKDRVSVLELLYDCGRRQLIRNYLKSLIFKDYGNGRLEVDKTLNMTMVDAYALYDEMCRWMFDNGQDVRAFEKYIGVKAFSKSPIVRIFHNVIFGKVREQQRAVEQKLMLLQELKRKAKLKDPLHALNAQYEELFMETDEHGRKTGYFISRIHRQRFEKAKEEAFDRMLFTGDHSIESLIQNELGDPNFELQLDEFGEPIIPDTVSEQAQDAILESYYLQVEDWKCNNVHRQFVPAYYQARLKILGVQAIRAENQIQREINRLLKLCMSNGKPRPELLSAGLARRLKDLYKKKKLLSSPFDEFGREKLHGSREHDIYLAEKEWHEHNKYLQYKLDEDAYKESYDSATDKDAFEARNTYRMISQAFWDYFQLKYPKSGKEDVKYDTDYGHYSYNELTEMRRKLVSTIKDSGLSQPTFDKVWDDETGTIRPEYELFFANLKALDKSIEQVKDLIFEKNSKPNTLITRKMRKTNFAFVTVNGKKVKQSWFSYIEGRIADKWKASGDPNWKQKAADETKALTYVDNDGKVTPLSIFFWTSPQKTKIVVDGKSIDTIERTPISLFSRLDLEATSQTLLDNGEEDFINHEYNPELNEHEQPIESIYGNKKYKRFDRNAPSSERASDAVIDYYEALVKTMNDGYSHLPFNENKSMKVPQIGMSYMEAFHKYGWKIWKTLKYIYKRTSGITEQDEEYIEHEYDVRTDKSVAKRIPIRYLKMFDDQREVTENLLGSVIAFYDMATAYSTKRDLSSAAIAIHEQMKSIGTDNQRSVFEDLVDKNIYDRKMSWMPTGAFGKTIKVIAKRTELWKTFALLGLLAGKASSGLVALLDAMLTLIQDSVVGKHARQRSLWAGWMHMLCSSPKLLLSLFSSKLYSSTSKLMAYFGLHEPATNRARTSSKNPMTKNLNWALLMMSPFSFADYTIKAMSLEESLNNYRWCEESGKFLQYNEFMEFYARNGYSYKMASRDYSKAPTLRSGFDLSSSDKLFANSKSGRILLDMYDNDIEVYNSFINSVSGKVMYRSGYYNGLVEDTSKTSLLSNPFSGWVVMVRNFMLIMLANKFSTNDDFFIYGNDDNVDEDLMEEYLNSDEGQEDLNNDDMFGQSKNKSYTKESKISKKAIEERRLHYRKGYYNFMYNTKYSPELLGAVNAIFRQYDEDPSVTHSLIVRLFHNIGNLLLYKLSEWWKSHHKITGTLSQDAYNRYGSELSEKRKRKLISDTEIDAINTLVCSLITVGLLTVVSATFHNMLIDDYDDLLWFRVLDKILLRLGIEKMSGYSFTTITELITAVAAGQSSFDKLEFIGIVSDLLQLAQGDDSPLKRKKTGAFKGLTQLFQDCINTCAFLGLRGIYSDTNIEATKASTKFYMDLSTMPVIGNASAFWKDNKKGFMYKKGGSGNGFGIPTMPMEPMEPMTPMEPMPW